MSGWRAFAGMLLLAPLLLGGSARSQSGDLSLVAAGGKNPEIAGTLSVLLPGLGHIYAGEPVKGAVLTGLFGAAIGAAVAVDIGDTPGSIKPAGWLSVIAIGGVYAYALIDAPFAAQRENERSYGDHPLSVAIGPGVALRGGSEVFSGISAAVRFSL
jgi:TM2 domain-containing membrane protein YozV